MDYSPLRSPPQPSSAKLQFKPWHISRRRLQFVVLVIVAVSVIYLLSRQIQLVTQSHQALLESQQQQEQHENGLPENIVRYSTINNDNGSNNENINNENNKNNNNKTSLSEDQQHPQHERSLEPRCALLFFGLPRSFELLVLPSIIQNILIPNKNHRCDMFVHFYVIQNEERGRSGSGGAIDPLEVLKLQDAVRDLYSNNNDNNNNEHPATTTTTTTTAENNNSSSTTTTTTTRKNIPLVFFTNDTDADFHRKRGKEIEKYRNTTDADGKYVYFPWKLHNYNYPSTMDNIVKQWHSIQSVWEDMERTGAELKRNYARVAMLRNDVVYVTPFDLYKNHHQHHQQQHKQSGVVTTTIANNTSIENNNNNDVFIPNWARYPVNDRMIYGPRDAVRIWATERFERLETHVRTYYEPGYGMHSERFLNYTIFPAIEQLGYRIMTDPDICFFRARADGSAWINDCTTKRNGSAKGFRIVNDKTQALVEAIVNRTCRKSIFQDKVVQLHCLPATTLPSSSSSPPLKVSTMLLDGNIDKKNTAMPTNNNATKL